MQSYAYSEGLHFLLSVLILPQKVATGTAYACLRPIEIPFEQR